MNIAGFSVSHPVSVVMRIAALVLLGAVCLGRLPVDLLPKVNPPTVVISTTWPNVAPQELETQVTRPIEQAVSSAPGIEEISSSTSTGSSSVRVSFAWGTDMGQAAVDILQMIQRARSQLPTDPTLQPPVVFKFDPSALPIQIYAVSGENDTVKLRTLLQNEIVPLIESADGVGAATVTGGQTRSILVEVDPQKLNAHGITLSQIQRRLAEENVNMPAGIAKVGERELTLRSVGYVTSLDELRSLPMPTRNGSQVPLSAVAEIKDSNQETRIYTRLNGEPAIGLAITKQSEANTVHTAQSVEERIERVKKLYPDLKFAQVYDQAKFIEHSITDLQVTALISAVLAILVLLFFLRSVRSTLVVALSIPTSIVSTFALLYFCGFTLNTISLSGLALATGLIVDDAVVVLENIFRHVERDKLSPREAAVSGANEIFSAVVASTITVMVVFLPLLLVKGQSGQMFTQFALVVIFSLAVSLLDATTVVPMLASRLIKDGESLHGNGRFFNWAERVLDRMDESYRERLAWCLKRPWITLAAAVGISATCLPLVPWIGTELLPQTDSGDFTVNLRLPIGTALEKTDAAVREIEKVLVKHPDVDVVFSAAGATLSLRGSARGQTGYTGSATVHLKQDRKKSTGEIIKEVQRSLSSIPGARITVNPYDLVTQILTGGPSNVEVDIFGQDIEAVTKQANEVMDVLKEIPGLEGVDLSVQDATPELQWTVDREKALSMGIAFSDIGTAISASTSGALATYYQEKGFQYPIYVQLPEKERKSIEKLKELPVSPSQGTNTQAIPLGQVATPVEALGPNEITRLDRQRFIAVTGRLADRSLSEVEADVRAKLDKVEFPQGTSWDFGPNQRRRSQEFAGLGAAVLLAIALIYMLLASQFESLISPLIVLTSVPLCVVGVVLALFLSNRSFGITAFIGVLMLIGIVVKNGILLVDYTRQLRETGLGSEEAILQASPTRLRPILMTTAAAVLGMLPLALALGEGTETQAPLATAVIGGLLTSTALTLFVVPCVYLLFDRLGERLVRHRDTPQAKPADSDKPDTPSQEENHKDH